MLGRILIDGDGRLYLAHTRNRYDVIDLSLAASVGLSNPGGFAIVEKYGYTREAMLDYMRALADGGVLSITLWNKEEPPKSVLKFYATIAGAAQEFDPQTAAQSLFVASSYLSTTTVLYKKGGFTSDEIAKLRRLHAGDVVRRGLFAGALRFDTAKTTTLLAQYRNSIFGSGTSADATTSDADNQPTGATSLTGRLTDHPSDGSDVSDATCGDDMAPMPATTMGRLAWHYLVNGGWPQIAQKYVFDLRPLTDDQPYFAGYGILHGPAEDARPARPVPG